MDLFRLGYNIGLKPDEVLDCTIDVFNAIVLGYNDYIVDQQALGAQIGYWSAYFQSRKPKRLSKIVESILHSKYSKSQETAITTDSDIQKFKERELRRMATYSKWEK